MARKTTKRRKSAATGETDAQSNAAKAMSRRSAMIRLGAYCVGGMALVGGGTAFALDFRRKPAEQDLSVIGNGTPSIVQIHDPSCQLCAQLQKETRKALRAFPADAVNVRHTGCTRDETTSRDHGSHGVGA